MRGPRFCEPLGAGLAVPLPEGDAVCGAGEFMYLLRNGDRRAGPDRGNLICYFSTVLGCA